MVPGRPIYSAESRDEMIVPEQIKGDPMGVAKPIYRLADFKATHAVEKLTGSSWLAIDERDGWVDFLLLEFTSECDEFGVVVSIPVRGSGTTGSLRELRHTWWGDENDREDGYWFYPNLEAVALMAIRLQRYFDVRP